MSRRGLALAFVLVLILPLTATGCSQSTTIDGIVDHKVMSGIKDSTQYEIVFSSPDDDGTPVNFVAQMMIFRTASYYMANWLSPKTSRIR